MGNLFGGGRTFLSAIAIGERTFGHLTGKKAGGGRTFLSAIAIGERTFGHPTGKFIWRRSNFSFRDSYRRKNFWTPWRNKNTIKFKTNIVFYYGIFLTNYDTRHTSFW